MTVDACPQWRDDLGALAVGQLEPHRELALLEHLDGCPSCREDAEELSYVANLIPLAHTARLTEAVLPADLGARRAEREGW